MSTQPDVPAQATALKGLASLFREILDLKRVRVAGRPGSLMEHAFRRAWAALASGRSAEQVALQETAAALAAVRLAGLDRAVLTAHGLSEEEATEAFRRALRDVAAPVDTGLVRRLEDALHAQPDVQADMAPAFVGSLCAQPRAGATSPGHARLLLTPTESHGDHCGAVALFAVLLAPLFRADIGTVFLIGMAHHLHNATLPDAGYAGDVLIEEHLPTLMATARKRALADLRPERRRQVEEVLAHTRHLDTPEAKAFHAADALDRVLEIEWHARTAAFTLEQATGDLDLIHDGFEQAFQQRMLAEAGLV